MFPAIHCSLLPYLRVAIEIAVYHVGLSFLFLFFFLSFFFFGQTNLIRLNFVCIKNNHRRTAHTATAQCWLFYMSADTCSFINSNLCYEDRIKKNHLDAQLILSIFHQPRHVSGISRPIIKRYNHMYTTTGTYYPTRITDSHLKRIINTNCCIHMVVPPDDGLRHA